MRRVSVVALIWLVMTAGSPAAAADAEEAKPRVREVAAWRAKIVEKAVYGWISSFRNGHAAVNRDGKCTVAAKCEGGKWGYYSSQGRWSLEPRFDGPGEAGKEGVVARLAGQFGFFTWAGKALVPPRYATLERLDNGFFTALVAKPGDPELLDSNGVTVLKGLGEIEVYQEKLVWVSRGERWGAYDLRGKLVVPHRFAEVQDVGNGLVAVRAGNNWALFDEAGKQLTPLTNNHFEYALDTLFPFNRGGTCEYGLYSCSGGRFGVLNLAGKVVVPPRYDCVNVTDMDEDGADIVVVMHDVPVVSGDPEERCSGGRWQLLKSDGTPYFKGDFAFVESFFGLPYARTAKGGTCDSDGTCKGSKWGLMGRDGKALTPHVYDWLNDLDELPMAFVRDGKWGFLGKDYSEVVPATYELVHVDDSIVRFRESGKWGVMDVTGKILVPARYEMILPFVDGRARFREKGKWGLIDTQGNVLTRSTYGALCLPRYGATMFSRTAGCGLKQGKDLLEEVIELPGGPVKMEGTINPDCSCEGATFGLLDAKGREVLPARYAMIRVGSALLLSETPDWSSPSAPTIDVPPGQAWVRVNKGGACNRAFICKGGKWGLADLTGRILLPPVHAFVDAEADRWLRIASGGTCEIHDTRVESCTPETKWGLMRLEPVVAK